MDIYDMHMGRSFSGTRLEDACPCPKAACGLVITTGLMTSDCPEHAFAATKTMRQGHRAEQCPGVRE